MRALTRRARAWVLGAVGLVLCASTASAQSPAPTAQASATAAPKPAASASSAPSSTPVAAATAAATAAPGGTAAGPGSALPAGHPPVERTLPQGHPSVDDDEEDEQPASSRRSQGHGSGFFQAPDDVVKEDPALPTGTIAITIADAEGKPIPHAPVTLGILHNSVAKGESRQALDRETSDTGELVLDSLEFGSSVTYRVSTKVEPATYAVEPFALSDKAGKRVLLHSYPVSTDIEQVLVGVQGIVYFSLREDAMQIEHLFSIYNLGPVSWVPDENAVVLDLPADFKAFNKPENSGDTRFDQVEGKGAALRGTFPPGRRDLTFRYQVPLSGDATQTFQIGLPPHVAQMRVIAEASKSMGLSVKDFPSAQKSKNRDGKKILVTDRQVTRNEGGIETVDVTISGLPEHGPGRWLVLGLGGSIVLGGIYHAYRRHEQPELAEDTKEDLEEARRALLDEIVALEKAHARGDVGPKTYKRVRTALVEAMARILEMLEGAGAGARNAEPATSETSKRRSPRSGGSPSRARRRKEAERAEEA